MKSNLDSPRNARRRANLQRIVDANGGASAVAIELATPKTYLSAILNGKRGLGDSLAARAEQRYGLPPGGLDAEVPTHIPTIRSFFRPDGTVERYDVPEPARPTREFDKGIDKIRLFIDGQHRHKAIDDDTANLLKAAVEAVQRDMDPTIRAAVLLMLSTGTGQKDREVPSVRSFNVETEGTNSGAASKEIDDPRTFARGVRADVRSAAEPEGDEHHERGKSGTRDS